MKTPTVACLFIFQSMKTGSDTHFYSSMDLRNSVPVLATWDHVCTKDGPQTSSLALHIY